MSVNETVGNAAAMREALEGMLVLSCGICANKYGCENCRIDRCGIVKEAKAALAKPPRNCDVGTAEEQYDRWNRFCRYRNAPLSQIRGCFGCPVYDAMVNCNSTCELIWSQMPCKEGGAK